MKSYRVKGFTKTGLNINNSIEGESIERNLERIIENKEPVDNSRGLVYTEEKNIINKYGQNLKIITKYYKEHEQLRMFE